MSETDIKITGYKDHNFHTVAISPWPVLASFAAFVFFIGIVLVIHSKIAGHFVLPIGASMLVACFVLWWKDVIKESIIDKAHNNLVKHGIRIGMALFIFSEMMFFVAFFWSVIASTFSPSGIPSIDNIFNLTNLQWPPANIKPVDPWDLPFLNTIILLLSGTTVTWAHHSLMHNDRKGLVQGLALTVILGISFTLCQAYEYVHIYAHNFKLKDGIYSSNFFIATGFHGLHVIIGTAFLLVCLFRAKKGHFTKENHLGLEFAAWYWHFVDVIWLFLFVCVYILGS